MGTDQSPSDSGDMSKEVIFGVSVFIAIFGTISNSLSLNYFIGLIRSTPKVQSGNTLRLTTKLFAALNIFDLIVSVSSTFVVVGFFFFENVAWLMEAAAFILRTSLYATTFLTCLLAVVRTINLIFPLYIINWKAVKGSILVYNVFIIILQLVYLLRFVKSISKAIDMDTLFAVFFNIELFILVSVFLIVVVSNGISLETLFVSQRHSASWKRKATVTIAIISAIYCICNITYIVVIGITSYTMITEDYALHRKLVPDELMNISYFILLPLNSACNPVVYMNRRADMRSYVGTLSVRLLDSVRGMRQDVNEDACRVEAAMIDNTNRV